MRKITGKALATVLAMALITSSFSGTFAFAATTTEKAGGVGFDGDDEITLVKDTGASNAYSFDLYNDLIKGMTLDTADKEYTGEDVDPDDITFRHAKGDSLVAIRDGKVRIKSDKTGTETIMVYGEKIITRDDDKEVKLKGQKEITIHVVESGTLFVGIENVPEGETGKELPALEMSRNDVAVKDVKVYKAMAEIDHNRQEKNWVEGTEDDENPVPKGNLQAVYVPLDEKEISGTEGAAPTTEKGIYVDGDKEYRIEASSSSRFDVDNEDKVTTIKNSNSGTGTMKLTIKDEKNKTVDTTTATILKRIDVSATATIKKDGSKTIVDPDTAANKFNGNVSGYDINVTDAAAVINVDEKVSLGEIKGAAFVNVDEKAKVGDIKDGKGAEITGGTAGAIEVEGDVTVSDGRVASIKVTSATGKDSTIKIEGGTVDGDVIADDDDTLIQINAQDDEINTVISGKVEGKDIEIGADSEDATVSIGTVLIKTDGEARLSDKNIEIEKLDGDYKGNVEFNAFEGKIKNMLNVNEVNVDEDSDVVVEGPVAIDSLDIAEDGIIEFRDTVKVAAVSGDGKLVVGVDKLTVTDNVSGEVKLRLAGANVNIGDKAFTAGKDAAEIDSFVGDGYKMEKKSVNKDTDAFLVKSTFFAGLALDKNEVTIAKGFSNTVTVSNYPASTSLPTGASVVWDFSDADKDIFDITADGATLNIAVKDYDDVYATSNSFDLYATVVDKDGDALEDYDSAKCTVNAIKEVPVSSDLSGIVEVPQGSTKDFVVNSSVEAPVTIGTGDVAVHAVKTPFANAQATYTIKATGAVGTTAGVYATVPGQVATKLFIIKVTAPVVTSDTTVDFDLTAGSRYVFKITAPAAPSFTVGNGDVLKTQAGKIDGNDYYFAVYAQNVAGQSTGVYVNGVKVCTVTVK